MKFLIVCCLADKILDSKRFCTEEQQKIINLLTMERRRQEASFFELGELLEEIDHYIEEYENTELKEKNFKINIRCFYIRTIYVETFVTGKGSF